MNSSTGDFNYTGLVENMKVKAGMFYGLSIALPCIRSKGEANDSPLV
jgi:hypothetical protein